MDQLVRQADAGQDVRQPSRSMSGLSGRCLTTSTERPSPYIVRQYVEGAGYSGILDYRWEGIKILEH
jgi:hypothetical protein